MCIHHDQKHKSCKCFAFWLVEDGDFVIIPNDFTTGVSQKEVAVDIGNVKLRMYKGDITDADVPAIVNCVGIETDLGKGSSLTHLENINHAL